MSKILTPFDLQTELFLNERAKCTVANARSSLKNILNGHDKRLIVIVGPCSIHNAAAATAYATLLREAIDQYQGTLCILMRAYVEKSRTALGWKGFINDPNLDGSFDIGKGLYEARKLFIELNTLGVPLATEIVKPYIFQYLSDQVSWAAVGARTTESQLHREYVSSLTIPIGFKNNTNGDIQVALDAVKTAREPHTFLTPSASGQMQLTTSTGNLYTHVVLRGAHQHTNYDASTRAQIASHTNAIIDCSHGNSQKNHLNQITVANALAHNLENVTGIMIESYLSEGKQSWDPNVRPAPDLSITDACLSFTQTTAILEQLHKAVQEQRGL